MEIFLEIIITATIVLTATTYKDKLFILQPYINQYKRKIAKSIILYFDDWLGHESSIEFEEQLRKQKLTSFFDGVSAYFSTCTQLLIDDLKENDCYAPEAMFDVQKTCLKIFEDAVVKANQLFDDEEHHLCNVTKLMLQYQEAMDNELQSVIKQSLQSKRELEDLMILHTELTKRYEYVIKHYQIKKQSLFANRLPTSVNKFNEQVDRDIQLDYFAK